MDNRITIALVDDEVLFRKGLAFLLKREKNMQVVFEASHGGELIDYLQTAQPKPDIIVLDLRMPVINGVEATKIISTQYPHSKVIALTSYNTKAFIANVIDVGAVSYLVKNTTPNELIKAINEVAAKGFYYNDYILKIIQECLLASDRKVRSSFDKEQLTPREAEVLILICRQHTAAEIAEKLFLSPRTVEGHRNNLLRKTECKNMIGLIIYAIRNDFVAIDDLTA
jgi:DNA-binding NarL/FixJ family response regulator